ncbi:hypothetical protein ACP4OV_022282 [Aristida adscensionis]
MAQSPAPLYSMRPSPSSPFAASRLPLQGPDHRRAPQPARRGREMEETYPWRKQFAERAAEVGKRCAGVQDLIAAAVARLTATPLGDAAGGLGLVARLEHDLSLAAAWMGAVELLALRSGGHAPAAPLRSIDDLARDDAGHAVRLALTRLRDARARAEDALGGFDRCRGHLLAAKLLLDHPGGFPDAEDCLEAERVAAVGALQAALQHTVEIIALVGAAHAALANI